MDNSSNTGIRYEPNHPPKTEPLNQQAASVVTRVFSVEHILDMIDKGDIDMTHDHQHVAPWTPLDESRLIESILIQIPLPAIYFLQTDTGTWQTINGHRCLSTTHAYFRGNSFRLQGLRYLTDENGKVAIELPALLRRRLSRAQIVAHVIRSPMPYQELHDLLRRNNADWRPLD